MSNKYDNKLLEVMKENGLISIVRPRYRTCLLNHIYNLRILKNCINEIKTYKKNTVLLCDQRDLLTWKQYISDFFVICAYDLDWNKVTRVQCEEIMSRLIEKNNAELIILAFPYRVNLFALSLVYSINLPCDCVSVYDLVNEHGGDSNDLDMFFCNRNHFWKTIIKNIFYYYERYFPFLSKFSKGGHLPHIYEVFCANKLIQKYGIISRDYAIRKAVAVLCDIRDFYSICQMRDFVECNTIWGKQFYTDLEGVFLEIKNDINRNNSDSIIVNWVDNVSYEKMNNDMPWLSSKSRESINFVNSYVVMPWTGWALKCMMSGKSLIRDKLYLYNSILKHRKTVYRVYDDIIENGYNFCFMGLRLAPIITPIASYEKKYKSKYIKEYEFSSENQWNAVMKLASSKEKNFILIHNLPETHPPYISPTLSEIEYTAGETFCTEGQKTYSRNYLDNVLKWYGDFYKGFLNAYLSDHGDVGNPKDRRVFSDERTHKFFFVSNRGVKRCEEFLSAKNELKVLLRIADNKPYNDLLSEYVEIESYDIYNKNMSDILLEKVASIDKGEWMQQFVYRTYKYKYVRFADGEERFYILPDERLNCINDSRYVEEIDKIRKEVKVRFIDPFKDEFFKESQKLYKAIERHVVGED